MKVYSLVSGLLVVGLLGVAGAKTANVQPSVAAVEAALVDLNVAKPLGLNASCIGCDMCGGGPTGPHQLISTGQLMVSPGDPHFYDCYPTNCMEFHYFDYNCGGEDALSSEEQEALWLVATGRDSEAMRIALQAFPQAIKLNADHSSLQLYNCRGEISASVPLHRSQVDELASLLGR